MNDIPKIKLGSILISLLEPKPGHEQEVHRWYERDHIYAGCMIGENFFSSRRWIATRQLKKLRFPQESPITEDISQGSYLTIYWLLHGRYEQALDWSVKQVNQLHAQNRMEPPRTNISSGFYQYDWGSFRDDDGVPAELALEHPYKGVAMTFIDSRKDVNPVQLESQYRAALDTVQARSKCAMSLCLKNLPLPNNAPSYIPRIPEAITAKRSLLLHFFEEDPIDCWQDFIDDFSAILADTECADIVLAAPFLPTIPGTDIYVDQL